MIVRDALESDAEALAKAVHIRHAAYARHVPDLARNLLQPEEADFSAGSVVLLAQSHLDGSPLGTMRIQTNRYEPLALEQSLALPDDLSGCLLAEATRLGVAEGRVGTLVKTVLFKAFYLYCSFGRLCLSNAYIRCDGTCELPDCIAGKKHKNEQENQMASFHAFPSLVLWKISQK